MKVLIISHSQIGIYGAITSLKNLVRNIDWEIDMVYPRHYKYNASDKEVRAFFGERIRNLYRAYLPCDNSVADKIYPKRFLKDLILRLFAKKDFFSLKEIIREGNYDYVLLNSIILYRMINEESRYILYIRESYYRHKLLDKGFHKRLNAADKVVFIDPSIVPLIGEIDTAYRVINNPFDMSGMKDLDPDVIKKKYPAVDTSKIVIMIAGVVSETKGIRFAIEAFNLLERKDIQLLIVGRGAPQFVEECKTLAAGNENICFLGECEYIQELYLLTDYILRADVQVGTGRTVYEGLYAGCDVILQYSKEDDKERIQEYKEHKERFRFYKIRDKESLHEVVEGLSTEKVKEREFRSNIDQYIAQIKDFIG